MIYVRTIDAYTGIVCYFLLLQIRLSVKTPQQALGICQNWAHESVHNYFMECNAVRNCSRAIGSNTVMGRLDFCHPSVRGDVYIRVEYECVPGKWHISNKIVMCM